MGFSKSSSKREVYSNTILPQETSKTSNRQPNFIPKTTGKRRTATTTTTTKNQQTERNHKYQSRNKKKLKKQQQRLIKLKALGSLRR